MTMATIHTNPQPLQHKPQNKQHKPHSKHWLSISSHNSYASHSTPTFENAQAQATTNKKQHADDSYAHAHTPYASHA